MIKCIYAVCSCSVFMVHHFSRVFHLPVNVTLTAMNSNEVWSQFANHKEARKRANWKRAYIKNSWDEFGATTRTNALCIDWRVGLLEFIRGLPEGFSGGINAFEGRPPAHPHIPIMFRGCTAILTLEGTGSVLEGTVSPRHTPHTLN